MNSRGKAIDLQKLLRLLLVGAVVAALAYVLWHALASEETRIRWLLEDIQESFNDGRSGGVVEGLSSEYTDEKYQFGVTEVRAYLVQIFLTRRDPKTREFLFRAELEDGDPTVEIADDEASANACEGSRSGRSVLRLASDVVRTVAGS